MGNPVIDEYGTKRWFNEKGKLHKDYDPAVEYVNGDKEWWVNGKLHRDDGPAYEWGNGNKEWYQNGDRHRLDGPAKEYEDGTKFWWIEDRMYTEEEYLQKIKDINT